MNITRDSEYFEPVNNKWFRVPPHWIGDDTALHTFKILTPQPCADIEVIERYKRTGE